jgi:glycosyltransferase involved in cell wall biosynthesis
MDWMPNQEAVDWFVNNCWEKVAHAVPTCKLIIAGRNMPARFLKMNSERVEVIERVENGNDFYHGHDIMMVPLLSGSGLRIKIIEGMSYGKAIVSTSVGAEGIKVTNGQNILIADTPDQFANAVILLLNDEGLKNKIESNAKAFAKEHFDNTKVVSGLVEFYNRLNA